MTEETTVSEHVTPGESDKTDEIDRAVKALTEGEGFGVSEAEVQPKEEEAETPSGTEPEQNEAEPVAKEPVVKKPEIETVVFARSKEFFALMDSSCVSCHSKAIPMGELALDTYEAIMAGGLSGPAVVSGDADKSSLVTRLAQGVGQMPPGYLLTEDEIVLIRAWIDAGAPEN